MCEFAMGATIFRKTRFATAGGLALLLGVAILPLGCGGAQAPQEAARPQVQPMEVDRAYAAAVGRLVVEEYGYERLMRVAEKAGWVKRVPPRRDNALGQVGASTFVFVLTEYAIVAGGIAMADSPAPGPGDLVGLGILAVGLVDAAFGDHELVSITRRARGEGAPAPPAGAMAAAATAAPSTTAAPATRAPVMPANLTAADQALWNKCNKLHMDYKAAQKAVGQYGPKVNPLKNEVMNNRASAQQRATFCALLDELSKLVQSEKDDRASYIQNDCDQFDCKGYSFRRQNWSAKKSQPSETSTEIA